MCYQQTLQVLALHRCALCNHKHENCLCFASRFFVRPIAISNTFQQRVLLKRSYKNLLHHTIQQLQHYAFAFNYDHLSNATLLHSNFFTLIFSISLCVFIPWLCFEISTEKNTHSYLTLDIGASGSSGGVRRVKCFFTSRTL